MNNNTSNASNINQQKHQPSMNIVTSNPLWSRPPPFSDARPTNNNITHTTPSQSPSHNNYTPPQSTSASPIQQDQTSSTTYTYNHHPHQQALQQHNYNHTSTSQYHQSVFSFFARAWIFSGDSTCCCHFAETHQSRSAFQRGPRVGFLSGS